MMLLIFKMQNIKEILIKTLENSLDDIEYIINLLEEKQQFNIIKDFYQKNIDNSSVQYFYGKIYLNGLFDFKKDHKLAINFFKNSAEMNNENAQYELGLIFLNGELLGIKKDHNLALNYFEHSALQNNSFAQLELGRMYENGYGVEKNYDKALEYYAKSALQYNIPAINTLILIYYKDKKYKLAYDYILLSVSADDDIGQLYLAIFYENGYFVEKDIEKSIEFYNKSIEQNNDTALFNLLKIKKIN
jgi:TPR repeat protein